MLVYHRHWVHCGAQPHLLCFQTLSQVGISSLRDAPTSAVPHGLPALVSEGQLCALWVLGVDAGQCCLLLKLLALKANRPGFTSQSVSYISKVRQDFDVHASALSPGK